MPLWFQVTAFRFSVSASFQITFFCFKVSSLHGLGVEPPSVFTCLFMFKHFLCPQHAVTHTVTCGHLLQRSLAVLCGHLNAASGCKWPTWQSHSSGCKRLQVTLFSRIHFRASCVLNEPLCCQANTLILTVGTPWWRCLPENWLQCELLVQLLSRPYIILRDSTKILVAHRQFASRLVDGYTEVGNTGTNHSWPSSWLVRGWIFSLITLFFRFSGTGCFPACYKHSMFCLFSSLLLACFCASYLRGGTPWGNISNTEPRRQL